MVASFRREKDKLARLKMERVEIRAAVVDSLLRTTYNVLGEREKIYLQQKRILLKSRKFGTRCRSRCVLSSRARGLMRAFKVSRIKMKELASRGLLSGVRKSSW